MSTSEGLEIVEQDEAGNVTCTYIASGDSRVDVVLPKETKSYAQQVLDVFLPAGYPHSVTEDYIQYQIYDSLQAFSSSIAGLLASRAVLSGIGVGDSTASPTSALLLSILQESLGRLATIAFAHRLGTSLEPECKMYRLLADIFNDTSMVLDCLSPAFPKSFRVLLLSFSSCLRALCGVCAGSAKASLSAHFAKRGNLGELNAKDSSQETVISLLGMLAGSMVVSWVTSPMATWATLIALLSVHLGTNYQAVRAVQMTSLNRQRANILFGELLENDRAKVLSPREVSEQERVFEKNGVLRCGGEVLGHCRIGVSMEMLLGRINVSRRTQTGAFDALSVKLPDLVGVFANEGYILWHSENSAHELRTDEVLIVLKKDCTAEDQLKAWMHALMTVQLQAKNEVKTTISQPDEKHSKPQLDQLRVMLQRTNQVWKQYAPVLRNKGWDLDIAALETRAGVRAVIYRKKDS